jgi:hypothetical protein
MSDWRYVPSYRATQAHLWALTPGGIWRSWCGRMAVIDLAVLTDPLAGDTRLRKCRLCLPQEQRRKEVSQ